jgi:hypothetical protein
MRFLPAAAQGFPGEWDRGSGGVRKIRILAVSYQLSAFQILYANLTPQPLHEELEVKANS